MSKGYILSNQSSKSNLLLILAIPIFLGLIAIIASSSPGTPTDNWKIAFDAGIDVPYNYSTSFTPKVWLYNQGGNLVTGATLTCSYTNVNGQPAAPACSVTNNGDGSYSGSPINMQTYAGDYIEVLFSITNGAGSNTMREQHVFYAGQSYAAHGALWKIQVFNTSLGPSWNGNSQQKIYMKLLSDGGIPYRNNFNIPTITIWNSGGTVAQAATNMNYEEDGVYSYTISGYAAGDYYFEIYNKWSGQPTGGKTRYTEVYAGLYLDANNTQSDESSPQINSVNRKPYFPVDDDYVNITAQAVDNVNISSATLYYSVNNQTAQTKPMVNQTNLEYVAQLPPYLLEDNVRYKVEVSDGTITVSSDWYMYNVQDSRGAPNMSHSFLNHPAYWFGKSNQTSFADRGGDTNFDGIYSTTEKDNAAFLGVNKLYPYFKDMTTIKVQTLIMDENGKPVQHLTNVTAWLSNNTKQTAGTPNRKKNMTEVQGESGVYTASWEGAPSNSGSNLNWSNDSKAIWANYTSGEIYSVYIDINNDSKPDENITWLAYNFGDTFWGSTEAGKTFASHSDLETPGSTCGRNSCHSMVGDITTRTGGGPTCPDCHGVYKKANNGIWPVSGTTTDSILYGNSTSHPRQNTTNASYCGDDTCHNVPWDSANPPSDPVDIPGYPAGTNLDGTFNAQYPNPVQCAEHHTYKAGKIPVEEGHNKMVACKYCHGGSHSNNKLVDYNTSIQGTNLSDINKGTPGYVGTGGVNGSGTYSGDCYKDCHKVQVPHSLTGVPSGGAQNYPDAVPCDECHQNFNNAPMHQDTVYPYSDRTTCGACHQNQGIIISHNNSNNTLNPPRIPTPLLHADQSGTSWNKTGSRPYWVENENSCRFCHGRSYNEEYGLGRIKKFMGTNIINGTINSTSYWCASCHVDNASETHYNYSAMVNVYNYSFGVVPPEITNSTWKSDRLNYRDHSLSPPPNKIDRLNSSTYSDDRCFNCHGGTNSIDAGLDIWQHALPGKTDITPPASVTNLTNVSYASSYITWTWNDPGDSDFDSVMVYLDGVFQTNVLKGVRSYNAPGLAALTTHTIATRTVDTSGNINQTWVNHTATTAPTDSTPPASITNLTNVSYAQAYINWTWNDPADADFDRIMVYLDNVFKTNVTNGVRYYNAIGLIAGTTHTIATRTVDTSGNVNATWVNATATTAPPSDSTPPASITNLVNVSYATTYINWTWNDPADADFDRVMVYLDNVFKTNVTKGVRYYNAPGLAAGTTHTIATRTVDTSGNINATWVNHTASTQPVTQTGGKILVATNRYVILDDLMTTGAVAGPGGFTLPGSTNFNSWNYWSGINTKINATALYIDNNGAPVPNKIISFTLYWPNGTALTTVNDATNSLGLANFSFDLNAKNYYGKWNINAANGSLNDTTTFIYNWWGCYYSGGGCSAMGSGFTPTSGATANSPYLSGRDNTVAQAGQHSASGTNCTYCHQSFDGLPGGSTVTVNHTSYTSDVHRNISCSNTSCHDTLTTHQTNQVINSCYNSNCHTPANRSDISNKSTLNSATVATALSEYSINSADFNATFHTPNSTVPCIICHGPMHNISKPDKTQKFVRNSNTEDSQCKTCHSGYTEHNASNITSGGINCTLCHSDDVHAIKVFAQNATYITLNKGNPNPARGNCTNCHQNATFLSTLKNQPKAGIYTGRNPPQVQAPLNHSNDPLAGQKWNNYWTSGTGGSAQYTACIYCHGKTAHNSTALGRPSQFDGANTVNSTISSSTNWCASCHWQGYVSGANAYNDMVNTFIADSLLVPPENSGNPTYGANQSNPAYYSHSSIPGYTDDNCKVCHGSLTQSTNITGLMHNVATGQGGGPAPTYIPPAPTNLNASQAPGQFWINYTWQAGTGNKTDSYNVNVNGIWTNGTTSTYSNNSVGAHGWSNISVWAYNSSGSGKLSLTQASNATQVANNVPVLAPIAPQSVTAGNVLTFNASATDADMDPIAYATNATKGTLNPTTGVYTWATTTSDVGTYTWSFNASDNYGGVSTSQVAIITVNLQPTYIPPAPANLNASQAPGQFTINYTWQAGAGNATNSYNVSVNSTWTNGTTSTYSNNSAGPHGWSNITVYAYNSSGTGKLSPTAASQSTQVANNVPVQTQIGNKVVDEGTLLTFTVSATDADSDPLTNSTNATKGTFNNATGQYSWTPSYTDAGVYVWSFTTNDTYGGVASQTITVTVNNVPLSITSSAPVSDPTTTVGIAQTFTISLNRTATVTWYINGSVVQTNSSVTSATYTNSTSGVGLKNVTAGATDGIDSVSRKWNWTVSALPTYQVSGYVFDNYGIGLGGVQVKNGTNQTTTIASGYYLISGMTNGTYNFSYNLTGFNTGYLVVTISGADNNSANKTIFDTTATASITNPGTSTSVGSFAINNTWVNPADVDFNYTWFRYSNGTTLQNVSKPANYLNLTWPPHYIQNISAQTVDTYRNINLTRVWFNATIPNSIPVQAAIGNKVIDEGVLLTFTVSATDADSDPLTNSTNATKGTFNNATGQYSWTPGYGDAGVYVWSFTTNDTYGGVASQTITVTVNNVPLSITSSSPVSDPTTAVGTAQQFVVNLNRTANVTWYINGSVVQTNSSVTSASYTNSTAAVGVYNVTSVASDGIDTASKKWNWTVNPASGDCMGCHNSQQGVYPAIVGSSFGKHKNVNTTNGTGVLDNNDCKTCHYDTTNMSSGNVLTYACPDCHRTGNFSAPIIWNHRPPKITPTEGGNITTNAYCSICHNNSINMFAFSANASVSHYQTNASLIKPTVNQTAMPRFGFFTQPDATAYNTECNNCHNGAYTSNASWGNPTSITTPHTSLGTCKECHVNASASDLHNGSLSLPQTFVCVDCHTIYAAKYNAPNITGTSMPGYGTCDSGCHGAGNGNGILDPNEHNTDRSYTTAPGSTDVVYLNSQNNLSVPPGTPVTVTSNVSDATGGASRVGGAEYYIDDPATPFGKGVPMNAVDGQFDALNGAWEPVTATIDTSTLPSGNHTIYVRGMDIGKQWSTAQSATLTIGNTYTPPAPVNLANATGNFWINYTWQAGTGNKTDSYNVRQNGSWTNGTVLTYSNNSVGAHGWSNISVYAYNASGGGTLNLTPVSRNKQVANNVPVQNAIGNKVVTAGTWLNFTVSATDADNDPITYGSNKTKGTLDSSSGAYSWLTTSGDVGTYVWYFNSSDNYGGAASETITVTVNQQPTYIPPAPSNLANATGNFWVNYTWQAGAGNVTNSYNVSVNGTWTNGTTNTSTNNSVGPHGWSNITVYAYNSSGTGKLSLTAASQNTRVANNVPSQAPIGDKSVILGNWLNFTVSATDVDSDAITYRTNASGSLNPVTGAYSWKPTGSDVGTYRWNFNSSDNYGGIANEIITVTVSAEPKYSVSGYVLDNYDSGLPGAQVQNGSNQTTTIAGGYYSVINMSNGTYNFSYSKSGFDTGYLVVTISGADITNANKTILNTAAAGSVTNPNTVTGNFFINNTWTNPGDADFDHVWFRNSDGTTLQNISNPINYLNRTLSPHSTQNISAQTVDTYGNTNQTRIWFNATIPNNLPVQTPIGNKAVTAGNWLNFTVSAADADSDAITYGSNRTKGTLNPATGNYSWLTTTGDVGTYVWYFNSSDGFGGVASETITVTVDPIPTGTITGKVTNASSGVGINGAFVVLDQYPQYNATTSGSGPNRGTYTINSVPYGTYSISASYSNYTTNTSTVTVSGASNPKDFMLSPITSISGYVTYVPWTATTQGWTTPYVIANKGTSNATVNISYYNYADGSYIANYSMVIVPNSSSFVFREWTPSAAGTDGSAVVVSDQPVTVVVEQLNNVENKFGPYEVDPSGSTDVFLPLTKTTGGWTTPYVVVNRGTLNATVNITYYHTNGSAAGNYSLSIVPGASNFVFREWTPSAAGTDGAARITSDQPISVLVDMFKNSENKYGAYIPASVADTKVFLPWTATTQGWTTPFNIVNRGAANAIVNISYYNAATGLVAGNATVSIAPNEVVTVSRENSSANGTDGSAVIDSTQNVSVIVQQFNNVEGKFEVYTPAMTAGTSIVIPWTATTQGWTTPYVIANKGSSNASVTISYYNSANGSYAGNYSLVIVPNSSSFVFREWTPAAAGTDGSALVVSDQPVTVVVDQLNNGQNKFGSYTPIG